MIHKQLLFPQPPSFPQPLPPNKFMQLLPPQMLNKSRIQMIEQQSVPVLQVLRSLLHPQPEDKFPIGYLQNFLYTLSYEETIKVLQ